RASEGNSQQGLPARSGFSHAHRGRDERESRRSGESGPRRLHHETVYSGACATEGHGRAPKEESSLIMTNDHDSKLKEFIAELAGSAAKAEVSLKKIELEPHGNKGESEQFSEMMIAIRGTAMQLGFPRIAEMAGLGEELAVKGPS